MGMGIALVVEGGHEHGIAPGVEGGHQAPMGDATGMF